VNEGDKAPEREVGFSAVVLLTFALFVILPIAVVALLYVFGIIPLDWLLPVLGMCVGAWFWLVIFLRE
jgi:uncharacterized RDD family membrane protein YckC